MPPKRKPTEGDAIPSGSGGSATAKSRTSRRTSDSASSAFQPLAAQIQSEASVNALHDTLRSTPSGLAVLSHFKRYGSLNHSMRDELSARVVYGELMQNVELKISIERYKQLALEIKQLFPTESEETWFMIDKVRGKQIVSGRLRHKFYNIRRLFIKVGLVGARAIAQDLADSDSEFNFDEDEDEDMLWLYNHSGPFLELSAKWSATVNQRKLLQSQVGINEFVKKFPCLKQQHGWEMLTTEWESDNPLFKDVDWSVMIRFLNQELLKNRNIKLLLEDCETEDEKTLVLLSNFATIFRVRTLPKSTGAKGTPGAKGSWRPAKSEVQQAFFLHIDKIVQLREVLESRKEVLAQYKLTLQPFVVVVGPLKKIEQCLVIVDDIQWLASSPLKALDICFKVFFSLDGQYPAEARHIWLFIQRCVYKIFQTQQDFHGDRPLKTFLASHFADFATFVENDV